MLGGVWEVPINKVPPSPHSFGKENASSLPVKLSRLASGTPKRFLFSFFERVVLHGSRARLLDRLDEFPPKSLRPLCLFSLLTNECKLHFSFYLSVLCRSLPLPVPVPLRVRIRDPSPSIPDTPFASALCSAGSDDPKGFDSSRHLTCRQASGRSSSLAPPLLSAGLDFVFPHPRWCGASFSEPFSPDKLRDSRPIPGAAASY